MFFFWVWHQHSNLVSNNWSLLKKGKVFLTIISCEKASLVVYYLVNLSPRAKRETQGISVNLKRSESQFFLILNFSYFQLSYSAQIKARGGQKCLPLRYLLEISNLQWLKTLFKWNDILAAHWLIPWILTAGMNLINLQIFFKIFKTTMTSTNTKKISHTDKI